MESLSLSQQKTRIFTQMFMLSFQGATELLAYLYDIKKYLSYLNKNEANALISFLEKNGYKEISPLEELETFKSLMSNKTLSGEIVGFKLLGLIIKELKSDNNISSTTNSLLTLFNEKYNKECYYEEIMDNLKDSINKPVVMLYIKEAEKKLVSGIVNSVEEYNSITIDGVRYPFIGLGMAICRIDNVEGRELYLNPRIKGDYNIVDFGEIIKITKDTFGPENTGNKRVVNM